MRRALAAAGFLLAALPAGARIVAVETVAIPVADLDRSVAFYTGVLDFTQVSETEVAAATFVPLDSGSAFAMFVPSAFNSPEEFVPLVSDFPTEELVPVLATAESTLVEVTFVELALVEVRFVELAFVEAAFVDVTFVPLAL